MGKILDFLAHRMRLKGPMAAPDTTACRHRVLAPGWDSEGDWGRMDKIGHYQCVGCQREFTTDEGERLMVA